jgi:hypothetical protein
MAAAVQELVPDVALTANCDKVVGQALTWAGLVNDEIRAAWLDDFAYHPVIKEWYGVLIGMIRHEPATEALFEGAGNLGSAAEPIAMPQFTGCRLTPLGLSVAEQLLKQNPQYHAPNP